MGSVTCIGRDVTTGAGGAGVDTGAGEEVTIDCLGTTVGTGKVPGFAGREGCNGVLSGILIVEDGLWGEGAATVAGGGAGETVCELSVF